MMVVAATAGYRRVEQLCLQERLPLNLPEGPERRNPPLPSHPLLYLVHHPFMVHKERHLNYCQPRRRVGLCVFSNLVSDLTSASCRYHHL